jgi:hypothetical protein
MNNVITLRFPLQSGKFELLDWVLDFQERISSMEGQLLFSLVLVLLLIVLLGAIKFPS